jgi:hypothetical protein
MKLWLLRPIENLPKGDNPWDPWYDKAFGFVVRAETETDARRLAHGDAGVENRGRFLGERIAKTTEPWLNSDYSTCVEITSDGSAGVVIRDFCAA